MTTGATKTGATNQTPETAGEPAGDAVPSRTRALFERLASTSHRRSLTADRIFRQLRKEDEARERARQAHEGDA